MKLALYRFFTHALFTIGFLLAAAHYFGNGLITINTPIGKNKSNLEIAGIAIDGTQAAPDIDQVGALMKRKKI